MAVITAANPRSLPNPTEVQLEELEGLIRRMLDLPVVQLEGSSHDEVSAAVEQNNRPAPAPHNFGGNWPRALGQAPRELQLSQSGEPPASLSNAQADPNVELVDVAVTQPSLPGPTAAPLLSPAP